MFPINKFGDLVKLAVAQNQTILITRFRDKWKPLALPIGGKTKTSGLKTDQWNKIVQNYEDLKIQTP